MKILNAAPYYWPEVGGLENVAKGITDRLNARDGFEVVPVASCSCEDRNANHRLDGHTVHLRTDASLYHTPVGVRWRSRLRDLIRREGADVVLTHTPVPGMADAAVRAAEAEQVASVLFHHNDLDPRNGLHRIAIDVYRGLVGDRTLALADRILATSQAYVDESRELSPVEDKVAVVPPGVDTDRFRPDGASAPEGPPEIVFVGRLDKTSSHKGLGVLVEALGRLAGGHRFQLSVVGDGDHREAYEQAAREAGIGDRCSFHGFVPDEKLGAIYARARTVCLPSTTRSEGFGLVLLEAQASGTAAVGSDIGGIPQAIEDGRTGLLVEPGEPDDLAAKLATLLTEPKRAQAMGKAGRQRVLDRFSWEATADRLAEVLTDVDA
jgi:glycosyltransferase involved in cell wall biosynthesis